MDAALKLQTGIGAGALYDGADLLDAAELGLIEIRNLDLPAPAFSVHAVHTKEAVRKEGRLLPADAAADLEDYVLLVVRVLRQKQDAQLLLQLGKALLRVRKLFLCHFAELRIAKQRLCLLQIRLSALIGAIGLDNTLQLALLAVELLDLLGVGIPCGIGELRLDLGIARLHLFELFEHGIPPFIRLFSLTQRQPKSNAGQGFGPTLR